MKTLEDFKEEKPESWKNFGSATKVIAVLYFREPKEKLNKEQIREGLKEPIKNSELEEGLTLLRRYKEVRTVRKETGLAYSLTRRVRETFKELYQLN
jgi:hypothetical protein